MVGMLIFSVVTTSHAHLRWWCNGEHAHLQCGNHIGGVMVGMLIFSVVTTSVV